MAFLTFGPYDSGHTIMHQTNIALVEATNEFKGGEVAPHRGLLGGNF